MTFTQPICEQCWIAQYAEVEYSSDGTAPMIRSIRKPVLIQDPEMEKCAFCGSATIVGIYVRADPTTVPYPRRDED